MVRAFGVTAGMRWRVDCWGGDKGRCSQGEVVESRGVESAKKLPLTLTMILCLIRSFGDLRVPLASLSILFSRTKSQMVR